MVPYHGNTCGKAFGVISDVPAVLGAVFALRVFASKQRGQGGRCKSSRRGCEGRVLVVSTTGRVQ